MGIVYKAFQISLDRTVALKVLPPGISLSESAVKNFKREATTVAALSHANIVPVHAVGEARGVHYFAMDLIEGCAVDRVIDALRGCDPADLSKPELSEALATRPGGDARPT